MLEGYYKQFLINSNHTCDEILEGVVTSEEYADELYYRKFARQQINGGENTQAVPLDALLSTLLGWSKWTDYKRQNNSERHCILYAQTLTDEQAIE